MFCYFPQWLWNIWEGGLASTLVMGLNHGLDSEESISKKKGVLMDYLVTHIKVKLLIRIREKQESHSLTSTSSNLISIIAVKNRVYSSLVVRNCPSPRVSSVVRHHTTIVHGW